MPSDADHHKRMQLVMGAVRDQLLAAHKEFDAASGDPAEHDDAAYSTVAFIFDALGFDAQDARCWIGVQIAAFRFQADDDQEPT